MALKLPLKTKDFAWQKQEENYILVDSDSKKTYALDPISFLVWIQCDGKTKIEEIVDVFAVDGNRDIIKAAIEGILTKLQTSGLIRMV